MGTNYYLHNTEDTIKEPEAGLHIGKNSAGWVFHFEAHPNKMVCVKDAKVLTKVGFIVDEYGELFSYEEFWNIVKDTKKPFNGKDPYILVDPTYPSDYDFGSYEEGGYAWTPAEFC